MRQELVNGDLITVCHDLWVNGKEVAWFDLPQAFARLRGSSR